MRLGTSSPKISVMKVMTATTSAVAEISAARGAMPSVCSQTARPLLKAASPMMPLSTPMEVMPTCTVERNWVGRSCSTTAATAPSSPASAMAVRRALRLAVKSISDIAKAAFSKVSTAIRIKSIDGTLLDW